MAKRKISTDKIPTKKDITALDKVARNILTVIDPSYKEKSILDDKNKEFRSIIDRELNLAKGVSGGSIVDFVASMQINTAKQNGSYTKDMDLHKDNLFTKDIGNVFAYYQEAYKNRYLEMTDLKFITKFIPAVGEAVRTTVDAITSSDSISDTINFKFDLPPSISEEDDSAIRKEIERVEKENKLRKHLRNTVYKNTTMVGSNYVYRISYKELFEKFSKIKAAQQEKVNGFSSNIKTKSKPANESIIDVDYMPVVESYIDRMDETYENKLDVNEKKNIKKACNAGLPQISIDNSDILYKAMETMSNFNVDELKSALEAKSKMERESKMHNSVINGTTISVDGTKDINEAKHKGETFDITGTYIKYLNSNSVIKVTAFDNTVIGYYVIRKSTKRSRSKGITNLQESLFSNTQITERKREDAVNKIIDTISESVIKSFSNKFVSENSEYKKLIADCIIENGLDGNYNIQFIPAEYIEEFKINEDEDGNGVSILSDAIFPGKMLLDLIIGKLSNYFNKSGNKTVYHIYKGPVNRHSLNQTDRIMQDIQQSGISVNDILTPNVMFNKLNRDGNIVMPMTSNGKKLIELEQLEGQQVDMSTDYEDKLENMVVMATGVPHVIMEYRGQADFAKQIVSGNIKWAGRVCTYQADLEEPTTNFYRYILQNGNLTDAQKDIVRTGLFVRLPRPRILVNGNNGEFIRTVIDNSESIAKLYIPDDSQDPSASKVRSELTLELAKDQANFFDWDRADELYEKVMNRFKEAPNDDSADDNNSY